MTKKPYEINRHSERAFSLQVGMSNATKDQ